MKLVELIVNSIHLCRHGSFSDSPLLGKFCENNMENGSVLFSSSNSLYLNFVTTSYFFGFERGFKIIYDAGATGESHLLFFH